MTERFRNSYSENALRIQQTLRTDTMKLSEFNAWIARQRAEHAERMKPDDRFERLSASVERKASDPVGFRRLQIEDGWLERHVAGREPHIVVLAGERVKRRRAAFAAVVGAE